MTTTSPPQTATSRPEELYSPFLSIPTDRYQKGLHRLTARLYIEGFHPPISELPTNVYFTSPRWPTKRKREKKYINWHVSSFGGRK